MENVELKERLCTYEMRGRIGGREWAGFSLREIYINRKTLFIGLFEVQLGRWK